MTDSTEGQTVGEASGPAKPAGFALLDVHSSKGAGFKLGVAVAAIVVLGLGVLGYSMIGPGNKVQAAHKVQPAPQATSPGDGQATTQGTDYVARFEESCIPNATQKFVAQGMASDQAKAKATGFCQCVATSMSSKLTPEIVAAAKQSKQMPPALVVDILNSARSCQKL